MTTEQSKHTISRLTNQRDYWRRRVITPNYDAERKARWRSKNPAKYQNELKRNLERYYQRANARKLSKK